MRNPEKVLSILRKHSNKPGYSYERLYRILFSGEIYEKAYKAILSDSKCRKDRHTLAENTSAAKVKISELTDEIRHGTFVPGKETGDNKTVKNRKDMYRNGIKDILLQEAVADILESVYPGTPEPALTYPATERKKAGHGIPSKGLPDCRYIIYGKPYRHHEPGYIEKLTDVLAERIHDRRFCKLVVNMAKAYTNQKNAICRNRFMYTIERILSADLSRKISAEPKRHIKAMLVRLGAIRTVTRKGKEIWKPKGIPGLAYLQLHEIVQRYNRETAMFMRLFPAGSGGNFWKNSFRYTMEYSMYKTIAQKLNCPVKSVLARFRKNRVFAVPSPNGKGGTETFICHRNEYPHSCTGTT